MNDINSQDSLRTMQEMLADMLKHFHDFCTIHSLRYYVFGGTALGAARHKGFIPWDDDLDVCMPRPDYERLMKIYNDENTNKRYVLETPYSSEEYCFSFLKIYDTKTTLIERTRHPIKRGLYIDIFPLDGVKDKSFFSRCYCSFINFILQVKALQEIIPVKQRSFFKNSVIIFTQFLCFLFCLKQKFFAIQIDKMARKNDYESAALVGNLVSGWSYTGIMEKSVYGNGKPIQFETMTVIGPQ